MLRYRRPRWRYLKRKKSIEFSKIIFAGVTVLVTGVTIFACALMWHVGDSSALAYLIPAAFAELATATGFYYAKARRENEIKLERYHDIFEENKKNTGN